MVQTLTIKILKSNYIIGIKFLKITSTRLCSDSTARPCCFELSQLKNISRENVKITKRHPSDAVPKQVPSIPVIEKKFNILYE